MNKYIIINNKIFKLTVKGKHTVCVGNRVKRFWIKTGVIEGCKLTEKDIQYLEEYEAIKFIRDIKPEELWIRAIKIRNRVYLFDDLLYFVKEEV